MAESSAVSGARGSTQRLFQILKFKDGNNNGVIEEKSISNLWTAEENYRKEADIDYDGRITAAEAKYYLRNLKTVTAGTKEEYALTSEDNTELKEIFKKAFRAVNAHITLNESEKVDYFLGLLNKTHHFGFDAASKKEILDGALEALDSPIETKYESVAKAYLAVEMSRSGYPQEKVAQIFKEAITIALKLSSDDDKIYTVTNIGSAMKMAKLSSEKMTDILAPGMTIVNGINDPIERSKELAYMALALGSAGLGAGQVRPLFEQALKATQAINGPYKRSDALCKIATCMKKAHYDQDEARRVCEKALITARKVESLVDRAAAIQSVAETMSGLGYDRSEVIAVSKEALKTADKAEDGVQKALLLLYINNYISIKRELNRTDTK